MFEDTNNGHTCYCENCLKLQAENEQLYKEKEQLQKSQYCVAYEKDCHLVCKQSGCKLKDYHKYKQCLNDIEEIIKDSLDACYTCNSSDLCINCDKGNILKKIKQAKDGE